MQYSEMKNSEIPWVGEVPKHWNTERGKNLFVRMNRPVEPDDEVITCFRDGQVTLRKNRRIDGFTESLKEIGYQGIRPGDLVIHQMDAFAGAIGVSDSKGKGTPVYICLQPKKDAFNRYYAYLLRTMAETGYIKALYRGIRERSSDFRFETLATQILPVPPLAEQKTIAAYLDEKCSGIDKITSQAKATIEEYKAWKASVIFEAVTKGLDPNAEMKDSGIPGIGMIPMTSKIITIRFLIDYIESGVSVNAGQDPAQNGEYGVLKTSAVSQYVFLPLENKNVNIDEYDRVTCPVKGNTIIVSRMNTPELVGACGFVQHDYDNLFLPDRLWQVHFQKGCNVKYIWYYLSSAYVRNYYASLSTGTSSSMQNISQGQFLNVHVVLPAEDEQKNVVAYLDKQCAAIDGIIAEKQTLIDELETYKKSLIFETVTGKRRMC